jgi:fructokinase
VSVLCLGEILVDCLGDARHPGGAPANVACHVTALGKSAWLVSRIGSDADGQRLTGWLQQRNVGVDLLQTDIAHPTGTVVVREGPHYDIAEFAAWDFLDLTEANRLAAVNAGVMVFGTLAQRQPASRKTIRALVNAARSANVHVLCDLNLRPPFYDGETVLWSLRNCDLLKLNAEELRAVSRILHAEGESAELFAGLLREFSIPRGVLTCGEGGAWLHENAEIWHQPAAKPETFVDAVGAGDAFTAVVAVALQRGVSLRQAGPAAAELSAYVVSQAGATPAVPGELAARINAMLGS